MELPDERPAYLVLLTQAPWPPSFASLRAAYETPLSSILTSLAEERRRAKVGAKLDVAVPVAALAALPGTPRTALYDPVQTLVAGVYRLVCLISARHNINVEDAAGYDVRVLLVAGPDMPDASPLRDAVISPVVSLPVLARCGRDWMCVFSVQSETSERLLHEYLRSQDGRVKFRRVRGGTAAEAASTDASAPVKTARRHESAIIGGTFDHMHVGHKLLLTMLAFVAEPSEQGGSVDVAAGITGDEMLKKKQFAELLESWPDRQYAVYRFLRAIMDFRRPENAQVERRELNNPGPNGHAVHYQLGPSTTLRMVEISDAFGPTITEESITALVVSAETRAGGPAINERRSGSGWEAMEVFEVEVLDARDEATRSESFEAKLSSTEIRRKLSKQSQL